MTHEDPLQANPLLVSREELSLAAVALLEEMDVLLSGPKFQLVPGSTLQARVRVYDAALLRHCARILQEILIAAANDLEMTLRIVGRAHIEAFVTSMYLHFDSADALLRIAQATKHSDGKLSNDLKQWDTWLRAERTRALKRRRAIRIHNGHAQRWNASNPTLAPIEVFDEPAIPRPNYSRINTDEIDSSLPEVEAVELPLRQIVEHLNEIGHREGVARESFLPIYHVYRILSSVGAHPSLHALDAYIRMEPRRTYIRTHRDPEPATSAMQTVVNATYSTSLLACWIFDDANVTSPIAHELREALEPAAGDMRGWTPNIS
jgi:hypothetical protein